MKNTKLAFLAGLLSLATALTFSACGGGGGGGGSASTDSNSQQPSASQHPVAGLTFTGSSSSLFSVEVTFPAALANVTPTEEDGLSCQTITGTAHVRLGGQDFTGTAYIYCDRDLKNKIAYAGFWMECGGAGVEVAFGIKDDGTHSNYVEQPKVDIYTDADDEDSYSNTVNFTQYTLQ